MKKLLITAILAGLTAANVFADECAMCPKKQRPRQPKAAESCCEQQNNCSDGKKVLLCSETPRTPANKQDALLRAIMKPKVAAELSLSEEQTAKLAEIRKNQCDTTKKLQSKIRKLCEKQCALMVDEAVDEGESIKVVEEIWDARKELAVSQTKNLLALRQLLTPEQIAKANELMKSMRRTPPAKNARKHPKINRQASQKVQKPNSGAKLDCDGDCDGDCNKGSDKDCDRDDD